MSGDDNNRDTTNTGNDNPQQQPSRKADASLVDSKVDGSSGAATDSLATRIQNSARGLARNAFFAPGSSSAADLSQTLANANGNKGGSFASSSGPSAFQLAGAHGQYASVPSASSAVRDQASPLTSESFRSSRTTHGDQEGGFDEFHLQEGYSGQVIGAAQETEQDKGKGKERQGQNTDIYQSSDVSSFSAVWQTVSTSPSTDNTDGAAVVSLLIDKTFDPEFPFEPDTMNAETDLLPPAPLTQAEIEMIDSFRRQFDQSSPDTLQHHQQQQQHRVGLGPTSLVPDIESFLDSIPPTTHSNETSLRDAVLSSLPGAADWVAVEERYHDEVWGYLRPTLEAARNEIEAAERRNGPQVAGNVDGPAVRRLKMILKHMQA